MHHVVKEDLELVSFLSRLYFLNARLQVFVYHLIVYVVLGLEPRALMYTRQMLYQLSYIPQAHLSFLGHLVTSHLL